MSRIYASETLEIEDMDEKDYMGRRRVCRKPSYVNPTDLELFRNQLVEGVVGKVRFPDGLDPLAVPVDMWLKFSRVADPLHVYFEYYPQMHKLVGVFRAKGPYMKNEDVVNILLDHSITVPIDCKTWYYIDVNTKDDHTSSSSENTVTTTNTVQSKSTLKKSCKQTATVVQKLKKIEKLRNGTTLTSTQSISLQQESSVEAIVHARVSRCQKLSQTWQTERNELDSLYSKKNRMWLKHNETVRLSTIPEKRELQQLLIQKESEWNEIRYNITSVSIEMQQAKLKELRDVVQDFYSEDPDVFVENWKFALMFGSTVNHARIVNERTLNYGLRQQTVLPADWKKQLKSDDLELPSQEQLFPGIDLYTNDTPDIRFLKPKEKFVRAKSHIVAKRLKVEIQHIRQRLRTFPDKDPWETTQRTIQECNRKNKRRKVK